MMPTRPVPPQCVQVDQGQGSVFMADSGTARLLLRARRVCCNMETDRLRCSRRFREGGIPAQDRPLVVLEHALDPLRESRQTCSQVREDRNKPNALRVNPWGMCPLGKRIVKPWRCLRGAAWGCWARDLLGCGLIWCGVLRASDSN